MARKMRDSGVEWIGEVPEGWEVRRLRYIAMSFRKGAGITKADVIADGDIACIRYGDIYSKYKNDVAVVKCLSRTDKNLVVSPQQIFKGEILFSCTGELIEEIGKNIAYMGDEECLAGGDIIIVGHNQNPVFLSYALNSYAQTQKSHDKAKLKVVHISTEGIKDLLICLPSLPEQRWIADYLDEKCAAIDGAVGELKRGIEDCKAWKKAIIFEVVTGKRQIGFNAEQQRGRVAERPMRDSGIPWIDEIPEGWGMECVKHLFSIGRGRVIAATEVEQEGYPVYSSQTKNNGLLGYISSYDYDRNQLTWTTDGANAGTVFLREGKHNCTNVCGTLMPRDDSFSLRFVCYSLGYVTQYERRSDINGFKIMSNEMAHIKFPLPPLPEQQAIADYLDEKCAAIDVLVAEKEKLIADLEAYKKSLIFELVTGKREVA